MSIDKFIFYFFPALSIGLFGCTAIDDFYSKLALFLALFVILLEVFPLLIKRYQRNSYSYCIKNIVICIIISFIPCYFIHYQSFNLSYNISATILAVVYFFFLLKKKPDYEQIENIIIVYGCLFILCWIINLVCFPNVYFTMSLEHITDEALRGALRFNIPGIGFLVLFYFLNLSKYLSLKSNNYLILTALCFVVIVFQVTRQIILSVAIITIWFILRKVKYIYFYLSILIISFYFMPIESYNIEGTIIGKMVNETQYQLKNTTSSGEKDVRIRAYEYFFKDFNESIIAIIFGNGRPHSLSKYGEGYMRKQEVNRYYLTDVGFAAIYVQYGIVGSLAFFYFFYFNLKNRVSVNVYFAKLYMVHLVIISFASYGVLYDMITLSIAAYCAETYNTNKISSINS